MRIIKILGLGMLVAAAPAPGDAPSASLRHNLQCLVATSIAGGSVPTDQQQGLQMAVLFFSGAVFGADPNIDLPAAVRSEMKDMTPTKVQALLAECGAEMQNRGKQLTDLGRTLQAEAVGQQKP